MTLALIIAGAICGCYLAVGVVLTLLDWIDRRRRHCMTLTWRDTLLLCCAWPYLLYLLLRGINLDNS